MGTFHFSVSPASGGGTPVETSATTTRPGAEVPAARALPLAPGSYTITETVPTSSRGRWRLARVECNGVRQARDAPVHVTIVAGSGVACRFENVFIPVGAIVIRKIAYGGTGTAGFTIYPQTSPPSTVIFSKVAEVEKQGVAVLARGDKTNALPLGRYRIREFAVHGNSAGWALTSVVCNGRSSGRARVP